MNAIYAQPVNSEDLVEFFQLYQRYFELSKTRNHEYIGPKLEIFGDGSGNIQRMWTDKGLEGKKVFTFENVDSASIQKLRSLINLEFGE